MMALSDSFAGATILILCVPPLIITLTAGLLIIHRGASPIWMWRSWWLYLVISLPTFSFIYFHEHALSISIVELLCIGGVYVLMRGLFALGGANPREVMEAEWAQMKARREARAQGTTSSGEFGSSNPAAANPMRGWSAPAMWAWRITWLVAEILVVSAMLRLFEPENASSRVRIVVIATQLTVVCYAIAHVALSKRLRNGN